ncbi:MAG: copper-binding protein [Pseudomonadota bacterium]
MKTLTTLIAAALLGTTGLSMAQSMQMPMKPAASASASAMPLVNGEVRKLDPATGLIVLRHGDIPNLAMPAMTMGFDIADKMMLDGFKVGDKVRFQAEMVKGKATVTELKSAK